MILDEMDKRFVFDEGIEKACDEIVPLRGDGRGVSLHRVVAEYLVCGFDSADFNREDSKDGPFKYLLETEGGEKRMDKAVRRDRIGAKRSSEETGQQRVGLVRWDLRYPKQTC